MFGLIVPNFQTLSQEEKSRYWAIYCGLCHSLRDNYSNITRLALSYDLTFLVLLLSSLYEPKENEDFCNCVFHPGKKYKTSQNSFSDYCADLTIAFTYHKIVDDINDEDSLKAKVGQRALNKHYKKASVRIPDFCKYIETGMKEIQVHESKLDIESGDKVAKTFGMVLGKAFAPYDDIFAPDLMKFGANLGRFIYFMDAAVDLEKDIKNHSFNPFRIIYRNSLQNYNQQNLNKLVDPIKKDLINFAGIASTYFEKLPLEQDLHLLQNILYEGIWLKFNKIYLT